jgi:hypothetical protein
MKLSDLTREILKVLRLGFENSIPHVAHRKLCTRRDIKPLRFAAKADSFSIAHMCVSEFAVNCFHSLLLEG